LSKASDGSRVAALRVRQWLPEWEDVRFGGVHQARPQEHFYLFSLSASALKALAGIQRREAQSGRRRVEDLGIQRRHDPARSDAIREYVRFGFPWSDLTNRQRASGNFGGLKKPGWLPTAIVVNILRSGEKRAGQAMDEKDAIIVKDSSDGSAQITLPFTLPGSDWKASKREPLEVIDGQHRLWAFQPGEYDDDFQLPVVAFVGLDLSWQAYLFWTINIKPKRINASLAFDLYPLLRNEDWLQRFEGPSIYRETRAQELTELLWAHPESPWYHRINMLGDRGLGGVTQAAWIRSLINSFVKSWEGQGVRIGGLFGAPVGEDELVLPWTREQQAAFLIFFWQDLADSISRVQDAWAEALRDRPDDESEEDPEAVGSAQFDPAFAGKYTLLNTDQGVRAVLQVVNDLCYWMSEELALEKWPTGAAEDTADLGRVGKALKELPRQPVAEYLSHLADALADFDWRTSSHWSLTDAQRTLKGAFRGSGGYRELRRQLLAHVNKTAKQPLRSVAREVLDVLGLT
jgi:DNA-sulfur modification-associated